MTRTKEIRDFQITGAEIRDAEGEAPKMLTGYAAVFDSASHDLGGFVEFIAPGAFARSLQRSVESPQEGNIFAFWSHRDDQILGSTMSGKLKLREDEKGLYFELDVSRFNEMQLGAARDGELRMSFGFYVIEEEIVRVAGGLDQRRLVDVELFEVSPVASPAYPDTTAAVRSYRSFCDANPVTDEVETEAHQITEEIEETETRSMDHWKSALLKRYADHIVDRAS